MDGYIDGLRDGGWSGSADAVRSTIAACGAAKYSWFAPPSPAIRDDLAPAPTVRMPRPPRPSAG